MTVAAKPRAIDYTEDAASVEFAVPWRFKAPQDVKAQRTDAGGTVTELVYGTDYTAEGGATDDGGALIVTTAAAAGTKLSIWTETDRSQSADYQTNDTFPAETHEARLDNLAMVTQEQDREIARAPKFGRGATVYPIGEIAKGQVLARVDDELMGIDNDVSGAEQAAAEAEASRVGTFQLKQETQVFRDETEAFRADAVEAAADIQAANDFRTGIARGTKAGLDALAGPFSEGDSAAVYGDATASNNGIYSYTAGLWAKVADLPDVAAAAAADRAEAAAEALQAITRIGSPNEPIDGTAATNNRFVEETAAAQTVLYTHVTLYAKATGTLTVTAERHSGNTFTVMRSATATITASGEVVTAELSEPLLIVAGEKPGWLGSGILASNSPADAGRMVYGSSAGDLNEFSDLAASDVSFEIFLHRTDSTVDELVTAQQAISQAAIAGAPDWVENPTRYEIDFTRGLFWNPDEGRAEPVGDQLFVRSDPGWSVDSKGRLIKFPADRPRLTDRGLRIEPFDVTNLLGSVIAPFTQTKSLEAGTYTASCGVGGAVVLMQAGAEFDRVLPGVPVVFTLAAAADITFSVSGPPEWFQCQAGEFATMPVSGSRGGDIITPAGRLAEVLGGAAYTAIVEVENIMPNAGTSSAAPILGGAGTSVVLNRRLASNSAGMFVSGGASISHTFSGTFEQIVRAVVAGDASTAAISANGQAATSSANPLVPTRWLGRDGSSDPAGGRQSGMFIRKIAFQPTAVSTASAALLSAAPARIRKETIYHPSSIDPASYPALDATICYDELQPNAPVLVLMHGWSENSASFVDDTYRRLARRGFFVIAPNMRARPAFTGRDASAREIVDILDAVDVVRQRYPEFAHARDAYMFGYSGGGGNVLAMAMKAPDAFNLFASHFGMSDYGYDATYGWYATNGSFQSDISNAVGGAPGASAAVDAAYRSRYAIEGIPANLQGGHLFLFHDTDDTLVSVEHSRQLAAAMTAEGNSRYTYHESAAGNWNRWEHSLPNGTAKIARTENTLLPRMQRREFRPWHFPLSGSARVHGFLRTKHFEIVLDDRKSSVATVSYDVAARSYTVTPVTAHEPIDVTITQGGLSISQTISGVTALVPS